MARLTILVLVSYTLALNAQAPARATGSHPDFTGNWNSSTVTPIERPARFKDKAFFTPEEAAAWERETSLKGEDPPPGRTAPAESIGNSYNAVFYEVAAHVLKS